MEYETPSGQRIVEVSGWIRAKGEPLSISIEVQIAGLGWGITLGDELPLYRISEGIPATVTSLRRS